LKSPDVGYSTVYSMVYSRSILFYAPSAMPRLGLTARMSAMFGSIHNGRWSATVFTALHWMQGNLVATKVSIRLSVCLSVSQTRELWQNGRKICPDYYTIRKII